MLARAGDGDRQARERRAGEPGHHERVAHARPVGDPVPQDREVLAVHLQVAVREQLGREFGGHIHVPGPRQLDRRVFGELAVPRCRAIHPYRAGEQHPPAALAARRLEHARGPVNVDLHRAERVGRDQVDIARAGQVEDRVAARHGGLERGQVEDVDRAVAGGGIQRVNRGVDHANLVAGPDQVVDDVRTDETAASGHDDSHTHPSDPGE